MDENLMNLGNIHTLNLKGCDKITNEGMRYLDNCHTLNLSRCKKITNEGIKYLRNCHTLDLSYCDKVSDDGLAFLGKCHTLNLFGCNDITDVGLNHLRNCNKICIDVSFPKNISKKCIISLGNVYLNYKGEDYRKLYWAPYSNKMYNDIVIPTPTKVYNKTETFGFLPFI